MKITFGDSFHRAILFSHKPFTERYNYKNIFQLLPPNKSWSQPEYLMGEHPFVIEFDSSYKRLFLHEKERYKELNTKVIDSFFENSQKWDFLKEIYSVLSIFSSLYFFENKKYSQSRKKLGKKYSYPHFQNSSKPFIEQKTSTELFSKPQVMGEKIYFPDNIDYLLDVYFHLNEEVLDTFRMSITLLYKSYEIKSVSPSMSLVSMISSIENLVNYEGKNIKYPTCPECNQKIRSISKRFRDFIIKYSNTENPEVMKKSANYLYNMRSKIAHAGKLLYYDYATADIDFFCDIQLPKVRRLVSICLMNWMVEKHHGTTSFNRSREKKLPIK